MRMKKRTLIFFLFFILTPQVAYGQQKKWPNKLFTRHRDKSPGGKYDPLEPQDSTNLSKTTLDNDGLSDNFGPLSRDSTSSTYRTNRAIDTSSQSNVESKNKDENGSSSSSNLPTNNRKPKKERFRGKERSKNATIGDGICQNVDIRNTVAAFKTLKDCRVIEGFLQIDLIEETEEADFENVSFPHLREITGYLLLYRVHGLKTLGTLFPNLEVIRGDTLLTDFAFMVYEMSHLQEIGLSNLIRIPRGGVLIEKNPFLCYATTVNWNLIVSSGDVLIKTNHNIDSCPGCTQCPGSLCWNAKYCQLSERPKCHEQCLGACFGPTEKECFVCKHYRHEGKCVEKCPDDLHAYLSRRCIAKEECLRISNVLRSTNFQDEEIKLRPFNGSCVSRCPEGYEDYYDEQNQTTCRECQGPCPKIAQGAIIRHISDAQPFQGTTVVKGALEFQIRTGNPNIMNELTKAFGQIEEISAYLKITHSFPITSLSFFRKLKVIKGEILDINNASLVVLDNPNLSSLFEPSQSVKILNGRLFFHYNPKLCLSKIFDLGKMVGITNFTDLEVQAESNGEKVACNIVNINITVKELGAYHSVLMWDSYKPTKNQQLLSYLLSYIETEDENITYEISACGNNTWRMLDVEIPKSDKETVSKYIGDLKPYTRYGVFVKTFMTKNERTLTNVVGESKIIFFKTKSAIPSYPINVKSFPRSSSQILITWDPPQEPNGPIGYYMISGYVRPDDRNYLAFRDYCTDGLIDESDYEEIPDIQMKIPPLKFVNSCCAMDLNMKSHAIEDKNLNLFCRDNAGIVDSLSSNRDRNCLAKNRQTVDNGSYKDARNTEFLYGHYTSFTFNTTGNNNSYIIKNLRHYSLYTISISACGAKSDENVELCSPIQYTNTRTKKEENADTVRNVEVRVANNSIVNIAWNTVEDPNGLTVAYQLEYINLDVKGAKKTIKCSPYSSKVFEKRMSFVLNNLSPARYSLKISSLSLAGKGLFSKEIEFSVGLKEDRTSLWFLLFCLAILCITSVTGFMFLRIHQKRKKQERLIASVNPDYIETKYIMDHWEVSRDNIEVMEELGIGAFGMVFRGLMNNNQVAIKTISEKSTEKEKNDFLNEGSVMKNFSTFHIIQLLGVVSVGNPPFVVMEYMENGDLKNYLRRIRDTDLVPDASRLLRMAAEIADGMAYLESKKFVHRDLAARNCMVSKDLVCKIGDFGMARDVYENDYYKVGKKGLLPIRWMAPESLNDGVFTSDSDVWAYGVVLYEILTLAELPYQGYSNEEVLRYVLHKGLLSVSSNCPEKLRSLMDKCFKWRPNDRPMFVEIVTELEPFLGQDFCEKSFYHSEDGVEMRRLGLKKTYHHAAPIRFHWGNESARWVKEFEDNVGLLDQSKEGESNNRVRMFKNGFQHFANNSSNAGNMEEVVLDR